MDIDKQAQQDHNKQKRLDHTILRFLTALEQGDIDTLTSIYEWAARDPELAQLLDEVRDEWLKEQGVSLSSEKVQQVRQMVWEALQNQQKRE